MQRTSFVVHIINTRDEPIDPEEVSKLIFDHFDDAYVNVSEFTPEQYLGISEPDSVE